MSDGSPTLARRLLGPPRLTEPQPVPKRKNALNAYVGLPTTGWTGWLVLAGLATAIVLVGIGTVIVALFDPELDTTAGRDAAQLAVGLGLGGTALLFALADASGSFRGAVARLGLARFSKRALWMGALAWIAYLAIARLLVPFLDPQQEDVTNELGVDEPTALSAIFAGILIVIVAPLAEEMFFRGFVYAGLRRAVSLLPAATISGMIWGSLHLASGNVGVAIQLSVFGVILAWLYERSGTLWAPILAHLINNAIAFTLLMAGVEA